MALYSANEEVLSFLCQENKQEKEEKKEEMSEADVQKVISTIPQEVLTSVSSMVPLLVS